MNRAADTAAAGETREPPHEDCCAVMFTAAMTADLDGCDETSQRMAAAQQQPGCMGRHHALEGNRELVISYRRILAFETPAAQEQGRAKWYADCPVCTVRLSGLGPGLSRGQGS